MEPWSKSDQPSNATNHELSSQDVSPSPTPSLDKDVEIGQFVIFERRGENDEMQTLLKTVFDFLNENNEKMSTGEVCKYLYSKNAEYRKLIKSVGGIRKLISRMSSIEFVVPDCGGNNYLQLVGNGTGPAFYSDKLGTRYGTGKIIEKSNDEDAYTIEIWVD